MKYKDSGSVSFLRAGDHNYKRNEELDLSEQMISAKPDVQQLTLDSSHDFMVIACDGIWSVSLSHFC